MFPELLSRRAFLAASASPLLAAAPPVPKGKATSCIFLWMGGGMSQVDTFDPKGRGDGKKKAGCYYDIIPTAVPGIRVVEHLPGLARSMERLTLVRSITHNTADEHATATHFVHTGRALSETIRYPSIGSIVAHEVPAADGVPPYIVIGYPSASRAPGFLGPRCGYLNVTELQDGPVGFAAAETLSAERIRRRRALLDEVRSAARRDPATAPQDEALTQFQRLAGPEFLRLFDLRTESATLRQSYGEEFGQRCLVARRLVEAGVRFVEVSFNLNFVNGTGWDTHNDGQRKQHLLIQGLDNAVSTLLGDLERRGNLDRVLVVIATEFGRPPEFDAGGGRGHQSRGYTMVLAGGGLRHGVVVGQTDELSKKIVERPVTIPDFLATICAAMGIDPTKELYDGPRPVPITDGGRAIRELFA